MMDNATKTLLAAVAGWLEERAEAEAAAAKELHHDSGYFNACARGAAAALNTAAARLRDGTWKEGGATADASGVQPIPMRLACERCGALHLDEGEFKTKPHHTHACQHCGLVWRPAIVPTVGVRFLPGFRNDMDDTEDG